MPTNKSKSALFAVAIVLCFVANASAQRFQPFGPIDLDRDVDLFSPAELGDFGDRPRPNEGLFFNYERLNWVIGKPEVSPIGRPDIVPTLYGTGVPQFNAIDIAAPEGYGAWGNRFDLGYMVEDNGWLVSIMDHNWGDQRQTYGDTDPDVTNPASVSIVFFDPNNLMSGFTDRNADSFDDDVDGDGVFGRDGVDTDADGEPDVPAPIDTNDLVTLPSLFETVNVRSWSMISGVELMKTHRFNPFHNGTIMELFYGARYLNFDDHFSIDALGGTIGDMRFETSAANNLIGAQLGTRVSSTRERWTVLAEGRFLAAANFTDTKLNGVLGTNIQAGQVDVPFNLSPSAFRHGRHDVEFSPVAELRIGTTYNVTNKMALSVGWTGLYTGNIARASNQVQYTLPGLGLNDVTRHDTFSHGLNFGVTFNR